MAHARDPDLSRLVVAAEQGAELELALRKNSFHVLLREHAIVHLHASGRMPRNKRRAAPASQQAAWRVRQVQLQRGRAAEEEEDRRNRPCRHGRDDRNVQSSLGMLEVRWEEAVRVTVRSIV